MSNMFTIGVQLLGTIFLVLMVLICLYYFVLAVFALVCKRQKKISPEKNYDHTFAIVIPAHNEELVISNVLRTCFSLDYPKDKYKIFVVADNCSDHTADIAKKYGVTCLERYDEARIGKGYALEWAFDRILVEGHDAIVVLDADCYLAHDALNVFDHYLSNGDKVLQANHIASNPDENAVSYAIAVGNLIENVLFYAPKSRLGLSVFISGTGMVFRREILERFRWCAYSISEDFEYTLNLLRKGIRIKYVDEVHVLSGSPVNQRQLNVQRTRWASGTLSLTKRHALKLIFEGICKGNLLLIDAGWTLIVLSRPLVLLYLLMTVICGVISFWISPGFFSEFLLAVGLTLVLFQGIYFIFGVLLLGLSMRRVRLLLTSPVVVIRLLLISISGILGVKRESWVRTPRF